MISIIIKGARVERYDDKRWVVLHPSNQAILAYADTCHDAERVRNAFNACAATLEWKP